MQSKADLYSTEKKRYYALSIYDFFLHFDIFFLSLRPPFLFIYFFVNRKKILHLCTNINYAIKFLFFWRTLNLFFSYSVGKVLSSEMSGQKFHKLFTFQPILFFLMLEPVSRRLGFSFHVFFFVSLRLEGEIYV